MRRRPKSGGKGPRSVPERPTRRRAEVPVVDPEEVLTGDEEPAPDLLEGEVAAPEGTPDPVDLGDSDLPPAPPDDGGRSKPAVYDPVSAYYQTIRHYPVLQREEEHRLALTYLKKGDIDAAYALVTSNLRLVVKIALEYRRLWREIVDLIQEGNVGLMQAVKKYDPYRGVRFSSYAAWWIRAYIIRYIMNNARMVKVGTTQAQRTLYFQLGRERERLRRLGIEPDAKALASSLNVKESEVQEMTMRLGAGDLSLEAARGGEEGGFTLLDALPSPQPDSETLVADAHARAIYLEKLSEYVAALSERDRRIFTMRWMKEEPHTLQEVGEKLGITRERVRQLEARILKGLRAYLEKEGLSAQDFLE